MELRQLQAFVVVATELHFGHAADRLFVGQPTLSELIQRLERELGTPLLIRTTRHVALTEAGAELLVRSRALLDDAAEAASAVRRIGSGEQGTVRIGITPAAGPALLQRLRATLAPVAPGIEIVPSLLWLPMLEQALRDGEVDVAVTIARLPEADGMRTRVLCAQPLLVGLRPGHRLAAADEVRLADLAGEVLGATSGTLFPGWALAQQQALAAAGVAPPTTPLLDPDLGAARWTEQAGVDWILLIGSLSAGHAGTAIRPVAPALDVPFTLRWAPSHVRTPAVERVIAHLVAMPPPDGWTAPTD
ncbi:LysR family transcriptional regulator [uncultured Amnibacterium sp.]|uniref:LysR family transcriptional regulator n=1 Tax=uncultured Amnibacterium sp. TaxID=1631851 RepID=UPI0035C96C4A